MGAFNTKKTLMAPASLIPAMADRICAAFAADGYEVQRENLLSGGADLSFTKGNLFKAVLGMKTALKVTLIPERNGIAFEAGIGIFGQQFIPTLLTMFVTWPVLLTQIWGLVQQSKLDEKALDIAEQVIRENLPGASYNGQGGAYAYGAGNAQQSAGSKFCTSCGAALPPGARFCSNCGSKV